jgi:hypothetical protein
MRETQCSSGTAPLNWSSLVNTLTNSLHKIFLCGSAGQVRPDYLRTERQQVLAAP